MKTSFALAALAAGATVVASLPAAAQPVRFDPTLKASPLLTDVQLRHGGGRRWHGGGPGFGGGYHGYRGGFHRHGWRGGRGAAVGAGIAGLATGALIGGALASQAAPAYGYGYAPGYVAAPPPPPVIGGDATAYCEQRFKSYDPESGTYLGYDGMRHPCP